MIRVVPQTTKRRERVRRMVLTDRDQRTVMWINEVGVATREHVQETFFGPGGRSRCQQRLTLLFRQRYLDRLPGRTPNAPDIYCISRRSTKGIRLIRAAGAAVDLARRPSGSRLQHTLQLLGCRVKLVRACADAGVTIVRWLRERDLLEMMGSSGILPDAYIQLSRVNSSGEEKKSAFFLEVERSDKADRALREKFRRYGKFYYWGDFKRKFGVGALRVLVLIGSDYGILPERRVEKMAALAEETRVTFLRFAPLAVFLEASTEEVLTDSIWRRPGETDLSPLFQANV